MSTDVELGWLVLAVTILECHIMRQTVRRCDEDSIVGMLEAFERADFEVCFWW